MDIELRDLNKRDYYKAIKFAVRGMHFERYTQNPYFLDIYGRYFLYLEMERATQVIAAYQGDQLVGILMACMKGEPVVHHSHWRAAFVKVFEALLSLGVPDSSDEYDTANQELLNAYKATHDPDGELNFLAADPEIQGKGIGGKLLAELERREAGKTLYLFTDNNCTWQFYEHRGYTRVGERDIRMKIQKKMVSLSCYLYSKEIPLPKSTSEE